ncbi:MAG: branched-chain amino acid ABC transporter permease, partial [Alphaproteobacteria bacterium]|nr:branched-chain amino acid ABC transporter permease [Alphaproteobacteria bacterium]
MAFSVIAMQHPSERPKKWWWLFVAALGAYFLTMPQYLEIFVILEMSRFFGMALLALSMGFLWGYGGILSFGQTAFFGLGGYGYAVLALNTGETTGSVFVAVALGMTGAAILGYFMIYGRISDIYFSVITLVFTLILEKGIRATSGDQYVIGSVRLKGQNGIPTVPQLNVPWNTSVQLDINWFFYTGAVLVLLTYVGLRMLLTTPFGRVLVGIRENERRTELLGYDIRRYKLSAFILAGGIAGLGGAFYAMSIPLAHPEMFSLGRAADVIMWVLVGGKSTLI